MKGSCSKVSDGKYKLTISDGFDDNNKRIRYFKTVKANTEEEARVKLEPFWEEINVQKAEIHTFELLANEWLKVKTSVSKRVFVDYKNTVSQLIQRCYGNLDIKEITTELVKTKEQSLKDEHGLAKSTLKKYRTILSQILDYGIYLSWLNYNAVSERKDVRPKKQDKEKVLQMKIYLHLKANGWNAQIEKALGVLGRIDIYAEKNDRKIIIECKTNPTLTNATSALGQLLFYKEILQIDRLEMYCAFTENVPKEISQVLKKYRVEEFNNLLI